MASSQALDQVVITKKKNLHAWTKDSCTDSLKVKILSYSTFNSMHICSC